MKLYIFPPSGRVVGIVALRNYLSLSCEMVTVDLVRGGQCDPEYVALNPNRKMPTLVDNSVIIWESNAILYYMASKRPESGVWPSDTHRQADVLRWLFWESAHWDAESVGMVSFEKGSKRVLGLGPADDAFIERGRQNFDRFAEALNQSLKGRAWLTGEKLTIADFSVGGMMPTAQAMGLPVSRFPEIIRWYEGLASMSAWQEAIAARDSAMARVLTQMSAGGSCANESAQVGPMRNTAG
ncbi:MAG: glutathione S-transferase family protein [Bacillota bacterium]